MILRVVTGTRQRISLPARRRRRHVQLVSLRINAGYSRRDLSRRTGVSIESIRLAEELGFVPGPGIQFALAQEFGKLPLDLWPIEAQR